MIDRLTLATATGLPFLSLAFHFGTGLIALAAGVAAIAVRKGGQWHRRAGLGARVRDGRHRYHVRIVPLIVVLAVSPLVLLLYWMWRVRLKQNLRGIVTAKPS